jgi:AcrR family transcriptional regulator
LTLRFASTARTEHVTDADHRRFEVIPTKKLSARRLDEGPRCIDNQTVRFSLITEKAVTPADDLTPRARAKRDQIRDGAQRIFLQRGFSDASTDAIAAEAGVSKQTLYAYYPRKEDLLADVLAHLIRQGAPGLLSASEPPNLTTVDDLRGVIGSFAHRLIARFLQPEYLGLLRIVFAETPRLPELGALFRSTVPERVLGAVDAILTAGQAADLVAEDVDRNSAARMLVGSLLTYAILDGLLIGDGPPRPPEPERVDQIVDLFVRMIRSPSG